MSLDYSSICYIGYRIDRMGVDEGNIQLMDERRNYNGKLSNDYYS